MAVKNWAVGHHRLGIELIQFQTGTQVNIALAGLGVVGDFIRTQFIPHLIEGGRQPVGIVPGENI